MRPVHVLLIHQAFLSAREAGGTRHFEFGRWCVRSGHRFTVVASDVNYLDGKPVDAPEDEMVDGVRILRARMLKGLHRSFAWRVVANARHTGETEPIPPVFKPVSPSPMRL